MLGRVSFFMIPVLKKSCATRMLNGLRTRLLGGRRGVLNCWAKKQKSVALSSWESELFAAITSGTRSLGIQSEFMDLGYNCSVTVAMDSQSVTDHSRRRGHSAASKHVGLRGGSGCRKLCWRGNWSLKRWTLQ